MENAVDALKMAFAVFAFVMALTTAMLAFTQARETSEQVFYMTDKTNFYEYYDDSKETETRIVSAETIIPTLYRYYKEDFNVVILNNLGDRIAVYNLEEEIKTHDTDPKGPKDYPWVGNPNVDTKLRIDYDLGRTGDTKGDKWINNEKYHPAMGGKLREYLENHKFKEYFLEQRYSGKEVHSTDKDSASLELVKGNSKIWIIYQQI